LQWFVAYATNSFFGRGLGALTIGGGTTAADVESGAAEPLQLASAVAIMMGGETFILDAWGMRYKSDTMGSRVCR